MSVLKLIVALLQGLSIPKTLPPAPSRKTVCRSRDR